MRLPSFLRRRRLPRPTHRRRVGLWGARLAMLVLFGSFTLSLTAGFVYAVNLALLPTEPEAIHAVARNRCIELHRPETRGWHDCLRGEPKAPSDDARPFLETGAIAAGGGIVLTLLAARGRLATVVPAILLVGLVVVGTVEARRGIARERDRIAEIRTARPTTPAN